MNKQFRELFQIAYVRQRKRKRIYEIETEREGEKERELAHIPIIEQLQCYYVFDISRTVQMSHLQQQQQPQK